MYRSLQAYCTTCSLRRSNLHRQVSLTSTTTLEKGGTIGREMAGNLAESSDFHDNLGIFYMLQICDMGQTALLPLRRKACWGVFCSEKIRLLRPGSNPRTLVAKASTLPLDQRSRYVMRWIHFKFRCSILISGKIIKEIPGPVASGTPCI
jgi:hypothetical protein